MHQSIFLHPLSYICFAGLMAMIFTLAGFKTESGYGEIAARLFGALCGLALIFGGIWLNWKYP
jgi:hypothetical protein